MIRKRINTVDEDKPKGLTIITVGSSTYQARIYLLIIRMWGSGTHFSPSDITLELIA